MTKTEIQAAIANAPRTEAQMLANRRHFLFRDAMQGRSVLAFSDWSGLSPIYISDLIAGRSVVSVSELTAAQRFSAA